ncbi:MAG TPA: glutamate racemase [Methylocella sp.]|nr:glutamate racemase [Methylocella sp.]
MAAPSRRPDILIFDSGLGGLTVYGEVARLLPQAHLVYAADDAAFPYGGLAEPVLIARILAVMQRLVALCHPDAIVIACNTASTLALPHLRARFPDIPFIGTVPAIKPAASRSHSGLISVLATPGTVARDYTRELIRTYAAHCGVTLAGSSVLASLAESYMQGADVSDVAILREIEPAFVQDGTLRTDCIVLACTHYPLLLSHFERLAPWPVDFVDPAPAIARQTSHILHDQLGFRMDDEPLGAGHYAIFTSGRTPSTSLLHALRLRGIEKAIVEPMPLRREPEDRHPQPHIFKLIS